MTTQCFSTANSITEVLLAGDAVLNLTRQALNVTAGTLFVCASGDQLAVSDSAAFVVWNQGYGTSLRQTMCRDVSRLVVISEENCRDADVLVRELRDRGIEHLHCTLLSVCDADAFMDEEDTEAVTERLRQLGYI